jgi:hypothetical protein
MFRLIYSHHQADHENKKKENVYGFLFMRLHIYILVHILYNNIFAKFRYIKPAMQVWTFYFYFHDQPDDGHILARIYSWLYLVSKNQYINQLMHLIKIHSEVIIKLHVSALGSHYQGVIQNTVITRPKSNLGTVSFFLKWLKYWNSKIYKLIIIKIQCIEFKI